MWFAFFDLKIGRGNDIMTEDKSIAVGIKDNYVQLVMPLSDQPGCSATFSFTASQALYLARTLTLQAQALAQLERIQ